MVKQERGEKLHWVVRLHFVGLREGLGEDEPDLVLLQVGDVAVLLVKDAARLLLRHILI